MASKEIQYVIQEDGFWYVAAKDRTPGVPEIIVSAKGVANGLSTEYNDGYDFGPDSYDPTSTANPPYTQTSGIFEAINYAISTGQIVAGAINTIPIRIIGSRFVISTSNTVSAPLPVNNIEIYADGNPAGSILCEYNSGYAFTFGQEFEATAFILHSVSAVPISGYTPEGFINITNSEQNVAWISYYFQVFSGFTTTGLNINGFYCAYFYENQIAPTSGTPAITIANGRDVGFFGGSNYDINVSNVNSLVSISSTFTGGISNIAYSATFINGVVYLSSFSGTFGQVVFTSIHSAGAISLFSISGTTTIKSLVVNGFYENNGSTSINYNMIFNPNNYSITIDNIQVDGLVTDSGVLPIGYYLTPTISANPPASGTVYQNTNPYDIEIDLPAYATTSGTAGYVTLAKGATSSPGTIANQYVSGATASGTEEIIRLRVPAGWYYSFTESGVTFSTAVVFAD